METLNYNVFLSIEMWELLLFVVLFVCFVLFMKSRSALVKYFDEIIDLSSEGKIIFDDNGNFLKANAKACLYLSSILDIPLRQLTRQSFVDYLYDNAAEFDESVKNAVMHDSNSLCESPSFREVIDCNEQGLCLVEAMDIPKKITIFTFVDIRLGQQREEDLIQLNIINRQLMLAIQATTTGIAVSDPKQPSNPILFVNEAFSECVGHSIDDLLGARWNVLYEFFAGEEEQNDFVNALSECQAVDVFFEVDRDDTKRQFNLTLTPVFDKGNIDLFVCLISEVTLLKQREAEFFHAQKLESLGLLAAGVAHDFNNVLSIIGGYSVMAQDLVPEGDEKLAGFLSKIDAAANRGAGLTRKMLTFSHHKVVEKKIIDLKAIVNEQKDLLLPLLGVSIDMDVFVPEHEVKVKASTDAIGQILMNFVINARDAMQDSGQIVIDVFCPDFEKIPEHVRHKAGAQDLVCISVTDTGTGMDNKTLEKIFDPFFSTKDPGKGTGLGLSVVYGLVHEIGGVYDVSSQLGMGSTFSVYIPRSLEQATKILNNDEVGGASKQNLDGYTVLLAEDEPDLLAVVQGMLERLGMKVLTASNGNEALVLFEDNKDEIDIVLTDVMMPKMNGVKLAELILALNPNVDVVFMSGYPANGDGAPVNLPANASFVAKPVNYDALFGLLIQKLQAGEGDDLATCETIPRWEASKLSKE